MSVAHVAATSATLCSTYDPVLLAEDTHDGVAWPRVLGSGRSGCALPTKRRDKNRSAARRGPHSRTHITHYTAQDLLMRCDGVRACWIADAASVKRPAARSRMHDLAKPAAHQHAFRPLPVWAIQTERAMPDCLV